MGRVYLRAAAVLGGLPRFSARSSRPERLERRDDHVLALPDDRHLPLVIAGVARRELIDGVVGLRPGVPRRAERADDVEPEDDPRARHADRLAHAEPDDGPGMRAAIDDDADRAPVRSIESTMASIRVRPRCEAPVGVAVPGSGGAPTGPGPSRGRRCPSCCTCTCSRRGARDTAGLRRIRCGPTCPSRGSASSGPPPGRTSTTCTGSPQRSSGTGRRFGSVRPVRRPPCRGVPTASAASDGAATSRTSRNDETTADSNRRAGRMRSSGRHGPSVADRPRDRECLDGPRGDRPVGPVRTGTAGRDGTRDTLGPDIPAEESHDQHRRRGAIPVHIRIGHRGPPGQALRPGLATRSSTRSSGPIPRPASPANRRRRPASSWSSARSRRRPSTSTSRRSSARPSRTSATRRPTTASTT